MSRQRIVITGMGLVTPLGCGVDHVWTRLTRGESGIRTIDRFDTRDLPVRIAGLVPDKTQDPTGGIKIDALLSPKHRKTLGLFSVYALVAAEEALQQANWFPSDEEGQASTATVIASGTGGLPTITAAQQTLDQRGYRRISPFVFPAALANMAAGNVSIRYHFKGPLGAPATACAAGVQAIGDGMRMIRNGEAKVALVGGTEACIDPLTLAGFHSLKALSTNNENPDKASRPFDCARDGLVIGEGAGLMVIETIEHARARGARVLAEISGYGTSADAHHITSGTVDGSGAARAIRAGLSMANLAPDQVDYVNAHATSTLLGDRTEIAALRTVFCDKLGQVAISSTKSATGHLIGAAGGVEAIFTALAVMHDLLPPTINLDRPDGAMVDLDLVPNKARPKQIRHAISNGFGFGGVNASLVVSRIDDGIE